EKVSRGSLEPLVELQLIEHLPVADDTATPFGIDRDAHEAAHADAEAFAVCDLGFDLAGNVLDNRGAGLTGQNSGRTLKGSHIFLRDVLSAGLANIVLQPAH